MEIIFGTDSNDILLGAGGDDIIDGEEGNDVLIGSQGDDFLNGEDGDDFHEGGIGDDIIDGADGNDILIGSAGNDFLDGEGGDDLLSGGEGRDALVGENGDDTLIGGAGGDQFFFVSGEIFDPSTKGIDTIADFEEGADRIVLFQPTFDVLTPQDGGEIAASEFAVVADDADADNSTAAIAYSEGSGSLFYNTDGITEGFGAGGEFALLQGIPSVTASNIFVA